MIRLADFLCKP